MTDADFIRSVEHLGHHPRIVVAFRRLSSDRCGASNDPATVHALTLIAPIKEIGATENEARETALTVARAKEAFAA